MTVWQIRDVLISKRDMYEKFSKNMKASQSYRKENKVYARQLDKVIKEFDIFINL